jgi:hypothetical protein
VVINDFGNSKIRNLDAITMNEDVFRFYVSVYDVSILQELQGNYNLSYESADDLIGKAFLVLEDEVF